MTWLVWMFAVGASLFTIGLAQVVWENRREHPGNGGLAAWMVVAAVGVLAFVWFA